MDLCKYKNLFGVPKKGIHSYRLFGIAIVDVIETILGALLFSYIFNYSFLYTTIAFFIIGIILHRLFCVRTTVDKLLFPNVTD
jgi:hypothetical protein